MSKKLLTLAIDSDLFQEFTSFAHRNRISRSAMIRNVVAAHIANDADIPPYPKRIKSQKQKQQAA